jgi:hypothetical protein
LRVNRRTGALVAVVMLALGGCDASVRTENSTATTSTLPPTPTFQAGAGEMPVGRFLVVIGDEGGQDGQLFETRLSPPAFTLLAPAKRVSMVGACADRVVVSAGQPEVGFTDHLQEVRDGQLRPLDGLGPLQAFSPRVASDCRVAYTWVDRGISPLVGELRLWDPVAKTGRTLYRGGPGEGALATTDWGPDGAVAAVRLAADLPPGTSTRPAAVVVVRPDGIKSEVALSGDPGLFTWGKRWMAVMDEAQQATVFVDPSTGEHQTLRDWRPVVWSPDGQQLLVKDAKTRTSLALVEASNPTSVREIGRVSRPILDADWLS